MAEGNVFLLFTMGVPHPVPNGVPPSSPDRGYPPSTTVGETHLVHWGGRYSHPVPTGRVPWPGQDGDTPCQEWMGVPSEKNCIGYPNPERQSRRASTNWGSMPLVSMQEDFLVFKIRKTGTFISAKKDTEGILMIFWPE